jgi:hypothetical protein
MNFENISTPEKEKNIPKITTEEWIKYSGSDESNKEFKKWKEERGIEFDSSGIAKVELDGDVIRTKKEDFGTIID